MTMAPSQSPRLTGKHAELFRESLGVMLDVFRECLLDDDGESHWRFCVALFDDLQWQQQVTYLTRVAKCVLEGSGDPKEWSAVEKAAFYAVYQNINQQLQAGRDMGNLDAEAIESYFADEDFDFEDDEEGHTHFDDGDDLSWKEMIVSAYREERLAAGLTTDEMESHLEKDADTDEDLRHWHSLLESLADRILDDRDFEIVSTAVDADPWIAAPMKKKLGIKPNDSADTADESADAMLTHVFQELSKLAGIDPHEE